MRYYKILFKLANKVVSFSDATPPCFDGILAFAYMKHKNPDSIIFSDIAIRDIQDFSELPICKHEAGYFLASQIQYDKQACSRSFRNINSRWHSTHDYIADFNGNKRSVSVIRGEFKSVQLQIQTKQIDSVWFYFASEDIEFVRLLAGQIGSIGKKHNQLGLVDSFEIEELDNNPFTETLLRPIPASIGITQKYAGVIKFCTWKPPYHQIQFAERCLCPKP